MCHGNYKRVLEEPWPSSDPVNVHAELFDPDKYGPPAPKEYWVKVRFKTLKRIWNKIETILRKK